MGSNMNLQGMPMPPPQGNPFGSIASILGGAAAGMPPPNSNRPMFPGQAGQGTDLSSMPPPLGSGEE